MDATHNHDAAKGDRGHSMKRKSLLRSETVAVIREQFEQGASPRSILDMVRLRYEAGNERCPLYVTDIYNMRYDWTVERFGGLNSLGEMCRRIEDGRDILIRKQCDAENRLSHLLVVHRESLRFFGQANDILLLDSTYKTNKYGMPLLNMVFPNYLHKTMNIGFAFLRGEKEADYTGKNSPHSLR